MNFDELCAYYDRPITPLEQDLIQYAFETKDSAQGCEIIDLLLKCEQDLDIFLFKKYLGVKYLGEPCEQSMDLEDW